MKHFIIISLLSVFSLFNYTIAQSSIELKQSEWKGFKRIDLKIEGRNARLVIPAKAKQGNPWIFRARFPDWHTTMDSILLTKGFHIAYVNTNNMYGSPGAIQIWNSYYEYLTKEFSLNKKLTLEGVSRGGLFIYRFAKTYPERVNCIYVEAPVCDFKSWPGGKGVGNGSKKDWQQLLNEYGFKEEEALNYMDNPIDNLETLAKTKIPIWHCIGLQDSIVPNEENTFVLVNKYIRLGGPATIYPNTKGKHTLNGHHFPIQNPDAIVDFIERNSIEKDQKLNPELFHSYRDKLKNSQIVFERTKKGRVAFLGGSITAGGGWRDSIINYLQVKFPETEFDFISAGIPSMGTTPGAFRLERDVLNKGKIDLLFEEAAVNDDTNGRTDDEQIRAMEGIVRHIRNANPECDIVIMHFVDPGKMDDYRNNIIPNEIANHEKVAKHYNISTLNLAKEITERIDAGEFTWEKDFKNLHPSPFGHMVYFRSMKQFMDNCWSGFVADDDKITIHQMPEKLDPYCYDHGKLYEAAKVKAPKGWYIDQNWTPKDGKSTRANYVNVPMLVSETPGNIIKFKFTGTTIGLAIAAGSDAGIIEFKIDNGDWHQTDLFTKWSNYLHLPWYKTLQADLANDNHQIKIRLSVDKNKVSTGTACRIRYFYVNE